MVYKHILLASFVSPNNVDLAFAQIKSVADVEQHRIFIFKCEELDDYIFTYNVDASRSSIKFSEIWPDTISIHRKKETNTLFSINAMNELIKSENDGVLVPGYKIDWENYANCLLLFRNGTLAVLHLDLVKLNR